MTLNLIHWMEQALILASVGALLPVLLRVRHPRTLLIYFHLLLAVCLLLPLLQPWRHPSTPGGADHPFGPWLWVLGMGVAARLSWLLGGLWRIRQYRIGSTPLYPVPESVKAAAALTQADAVVCISPDLLGPAMLGIFCPVVLLPESFQTLGDEAQCGIACHEFLHVRRNDWLVTIFEELAGALLWFNPSVWWLLAQTRLAREQLVDAEAVRLTASREPYIQALLAIARSRWMPDLAPTPLFLRRRHLTQRMHSLLKEVSMSKLRLWSSYSTILAILAVAAWFSAAAFPLIGQAPAPVTTAVQAQPVRGPGFQPPAPRRAPGMGAHSDTSSVAIPQDPHEPITGAVTVPATPSDRAAVLSLFERAKQNSKMHIDGMPPFVLTVSFLASGPVVFTGAGELTETWTSGQSWRWSANLGSYSQTQFSWAGMQAGDPPQSFVPTRIHMLRGSIFWAVRNTPSSAVIRTAAAQWNGKPATCLLLSGMNGATSPSRLWEEEEFCMDNSQGLLQVYSVAPGTYTVYSYAGNIQFHGRSIPDAITIYMNGAAVMDAHLSITDAVAVDPRSLTPTPEMIAAGRFISLQLTSRSPFDMSSSLVSGLVRPVIVHAETDTQGKVREAEISASSDPALTQQALDFVKNSRFATGMQMDTYINVRFNPR